MWAILEVSSRETLTLAVRGVRRRFHLDGSLEDGQSRGGRVGRGCGVVAAVDFGPHRGGGIGAGVRFRYGGRDDVAD